MLCGLCVCIMYACCMYVRMMVSLPQQVKPPQACQVKQEQPVVGQKRQRSPETSLSAVDMVSLGDACVEV